MIVSSATADRKFLGSFGAAPDPVVACSTFKDLFIVILGPITLAEGGFSFGFSVLGGNVHVVLSVDTN